MPGKEVSPWQLSDQDGARWVFPALREDAVNQYCDFLHRFECSSTDVDVVLRISADTDFVVSLNGTRVGHGQYSDYPDAKTYERFPLQGLLQEGENLLAVTVFYNGRSSSVYRRGEPGLVFEARGEELLTASGVETRCRQDPSYHSGDIAVVSGQLFYTFGYDARGEDGFDASADYAASDSWRPVKAAEAGVPADRRVLRSRPVQRLVDGGLTPAAFVATGLFRRDFAAVEQHFASKIADDGLSGIRLEDGTLVSVAWLMQRDDLSAIRTSELFGVGTGFAVDAAKDGLSPKLASLGARDGIYMVFDLGCEEVGHIELDLEAPAGMVVDMGYGEHLDDLRVRTSIGSRSFAARYVAGGGRRTFRHEFQRWSGRYLALHLHGLDFTLHSIGLRRCMYPVALRGELQTGDKLKQRVLSVARRTLHLCMHEHYEDTPWREQALYANDARTQALCGYYAFGETDFPKSSFALLGNGMREDGFLYLTAPAMPPPTIPSFTLVWMLAVRDHVLYSGDDSLAREFLPQIDSMLKAFLSEMAEGLLPLRQGPGIWHFYDWTTGMSGYDDKALAAGLRFDAPLNSFLVLALEAACQMHEWLELPGGESFKDAAGAIKRSMRERFWDEELGLFQTHAQSDVYSELTQALAVLAGAVAGDDALAVLAKLASDDSGLVPASLSQSFYTFEAMMTRKDLFGEAVLARIERLWGSMLAQGATTFWETLRGASDFSNAGSLCHGWSAVPLYVYYHDLLGVRPLTPGYKTFAVDPLYAAGDRLQGTLPVPGGEIRYGWTMKEGRPCESLDAPDGCKRIESGQANE